MDVKLVAALPIESRVRALGTTRPGPGQVLPLGHVRAVLGVLVALEGGVGAPLAGALRVEALVGGVGLLGLFLLGLGVLGVVGRFGDSDGFFGHGRLAAVDLVDLVLVLIARGGVAEAHLPPAGTSGDSPGLDHSRRYVGVGMLCGDGVDCCAQ